MITPRICQAIVKKTKEPCTKKAHDGCQFCGIHMPKKAIEKEPSVQEPVPNDNDENKPPVIIVDDVKAALKPKRTTTKKVTKETKEKEKKIDQLGDESQIQTEETIEIPKVKVTKSLGQNKSPPLDISLVPKMPEVPVPVIESQYVFEPGQINKELFDALYQELMRTR